MKHGTNIKAQRCVFTFSSAAPVRQEVEERCGGEGVCVVFDAVTALSANYCIKKRKHMTSNVISISVFIACFLEITFTCWKEA